MRDKYLPKKIIYYLSKEFLISLFIFVLIFFSLILMISYIEEIIFFRDKDINNNFLLKTLVITLIKIPTLIIQFSHFIFLFTGIFFFSKLNKNNEVLSINISGISKNFVLIVPATLSFTIGIFIILILTPATSELSRYYENIKKKYSQNDNLIILSDTGLWIKENKNDETLIIRADRVESENFSKLNNVTIYKYNKNNFNQRLDSKMLSIKNNIWTLKNATVVDKNGLTSNQDIVFESSINFEKLSGFFLNANTFSIWNIQSKIKQIKERGYYGENLIIMFHKYLSLPFMLFGMIIISSIFTINKNFKFNNFINIFIGIIFGISLQYFNDISVAIGKSGKIPIVLSSWLPVIIIMTFSLYSLLRNND